MLKNFTTQLIKNKFEAHLSHMDIPQNLLNQLEEGNVVLFLGAGASYDAIHPRGEKIPDGKKLGEAIANKFLDKSYLNEPLTYIAEIASSDVSFPKLRPFKS